MAKGNILTSEMLLLVIFIGIFIGIPSIETLEGTIDQISRSSYNTCGMGVESEPLVDDPIPRLNRITPDITVTNVEELLAAIKSANSGDAILIREGFYGLESGLVLNKPLTIFGPAEPKSRATLDASGLKDSPVITITRTKATIRDLTIVGGNVGILLDSSKASRIWNNVIEKSIEAGILLQTSESNEISHNNVSISNNHGIQIKDSSNNIFASNYIFNLSNGVGFLLEGASEGNELSTNVIRNSKYGIQLKAVVRTRITGNHFSQNTRGFYSTKSENTHVANNYFVNNSLGIVIEDGGSDYVLFDNIVNASKGSGILLHNAEAQFTANKIFNNGENGILIQDADGTIIESNFIAGHTNGTGIHINLGSTNTVLSDNVLVNNAKGVWVSQSYNTRILGNRVYNSSAEGIWIENSENVEIRDENRLVGASEGILVVNSPFTIIWNNLLNQTYTAVSVNGADRITIQNNKFERSDFGIKLKNSHLNLIQNNTLSLLRIGISLQTSSVSQISDNSIAKVNEVGIELTQASSYNRLTGNHLIANGIGVQISDIASIRNTLLNNTIAMNDNGVLLENTRGTVLYHNNFLSNTIPAQDNLAHSNYFYNPVMREGNYWSDYLGVDLDHDGIGDTLVPHPTLGYDLYPLVHRDGWMVIRLTPGELKLQIQHFNLSPTQEKLMLSPLDRVIQQTALDFKKILPPEVKFAEQVYRLNPIIIPNSPGSGGLFNLEEYVAVKGIRVNIEPIPIYAPNTTATSVSIMSITQQSKILTTTETPKPPGVDITVITTPQKAIKPRNVTIYPVSATQKINFTVLEPAVMFQNSAEQLTIFREEWNKNIQYARDNWHVRDDPNVVIFSCFSYILENGIADEITIEVLESLEWDQDDLECSTEVAIGTNPFDPDTDDDGMPDGYEYFNHLNPLSNDRDMDLDGDGLTNWFEYQLGTEPDRGDSDNDTLSDGEELLEGTNSLDEDTDNDHLSDGWEVTHRKTLNILPFDPIVIFNPRNPFVKFSHNGFTILTLPENTLDLDDDGLTTRYEYLHRMWGTDPWVQDVLVEVDYIEGQHPADLDGDGSEDDFADVQAAFAAQDINLIIDIDTELPDYNVTTPDLAKFFYEAYFIPARKMKWRYSILANFIQCSDDNYNCGGRAFNTPNDIFLVARGRTYRNYWDASKPNMFEHALAGLWMHELGHNLGIHHGGFEQLNDKRNYVSVMNYLYTIRGVYITSQAFPPGNPKLRPPGPIDYSDGTSIDLYEGNLNEIVGIGRGYGIDWNDDGDTNDSGIKLDLNGDGDEKDTFKDFDDWTYIKTHLAENLIHVDPWS